MGRKSQPWMLLITMVSLVACEVASRGPEAPEDAPYVLVLGTAQDGGLPQIGCNDAICQQAWREPERRRLVTSLLLVDPGSGRRYLLDATPDLREQVQRARTHPGRRPRGPGPRPPLFDGIFLTHAHMGHYSGLVQLGMEAYGSATVKTYVSPRMQSFLATNGPWELAVRQGYLQLETFQSDATIRLLGGLSVVPIPVPHRDEYSDTHAFWIQGPEKSLLYLPDIDKWERWDRSIEELIAQVDHALLDGAFFGDGEVPGRRMEDIPHPFILESLARFAALPEGERDKIHFTHLNHTNPASDPDSAAARRVRDAGMHVLAEGALFRL